MVGVNMRLKAGAVRELHWHKEAGWSYMQGKARIKLVGGAGRKFADDVGEEDLWYFSPDIPRSERCDIRSNKAKRTMEWSISVVMLRLSERARQVWRPSGPLGKQVPRRC
jgi:hypothetical protein